MKSQNEGTISREAYWASQIAFDCPRTGGRHTIDDCFRRCHASDYFYRDGAGVMYCTEDIHGERELYSGVVTRKE